jgi:hypothetical protein
MTVAYPLPARRRGITFEFGGVARRAHAAGLIVVMGIGSVAMWTALPIGGLWLASQFTEAATQPSTASALMTMLGIPALMALTAKGLAITERRYERVRGITRSKRVPAYRRSISDSSSSPEASVLEAMMVVSVLVAAVAFAGWFSFFAGSSLLP